MLSQTFHHPPMDMADKKTGWDPGGGGWLSRKLVDLLDEVGSNDFSYEESGTNAEMFSVWDSDSD